VVQSTRFIPVESVVQIHPPLPKDLEKLGKIEKTRIEGLSTVTTMVGDF
jgi:hypothetical protein